MKRLVIIIIAMSLWLSLSVTKVQAYWAEDVSSSQSINVASISIGNWEFIPLWEPEPEIPYEEGDVVFWEGVYWIKTKQGGNSNIEPGSPAGWVFWDEVN